MFTILTSVLAALSFGFPVALAQGTPADAPIASVDPVAGIAITAPAQVRIDRAFLASAATGAMGGGALRWDFGDATGADGAVVTHSYAKPGRYKVTLTFTPDAPGGAKVIAAHDLIAYTRAAILLTSRADRAEEQELRALATTADIALSIVPVTGHSPVLLQQALQGELATRIEEIREADRIVFATPADSTLNALSGLGEGPVAAALKGKSLVLVTEARANALTRQARIVHRQLGAERVILAQRATLEPLLRAPDLRVALTELEELDAAPAVIDRKTPGPPASALLSRLVDYLLGLRVPAQTILLILLVPVMVAVISFLRQVVGISTMGLFLPLTMALSYVFMGLRVGLLLTVVIIAAGIALRWALRRVHMLYMGRVGIATSIIVLLLLVVALVVARFAPDSLPNLSILPMLLLALMTERTYGVIAERGLKPALLVLVETMIVATLAAVVATQWEGLRTFLFSWPEAVLVFLAAQVLIGRYTGLRATEILRFRDLLNEVEYAEEE